jgi:calcium-dependent protein kinase
LENCIGGNLLDKMIERENMGKTLSEKESASIFKQILSAIYYLHAKKFVYGNLQPENILFVNESINSDIKLIDFSKAQVLPGEKEKKLNKVVGIAMFMAPEMILHEYDEKCDIWSLGVLLYMMLCGLPPFMGISDNDVKESILQGKFIFFSPGN